jgi:uncharacterized membrane protein YccF (DUF307 family)
MTIVTTATIKFSLMIVIIIIIISGLAYNAACSKYTDMKIVAFGVSIYFGSLMSLGFPHR